MGSTVAVTGAAQQVAAVSAALRNAGAKVIAHKKQRTVHVGDHVTLIFEDELTIRYQVQEMLRVERIFEEVSLPADRFTRAVERFEQEGKA